MKQCVCICALLIAGMLCAAEAPAVKLAADFVVPGPVINMVPQSGVAKIFKIVTQSNMEVQVRFYAADIFRIQAGRKVAGAKAGSYTVAYDDPRNDPTKAQILVDFKESPDRVVFADLPDAYTFTTRAVVLMLNKSDCTFSAKDRTGRVLFAEAKPISLNEKASIQTFKTDDDEFFYGGGQQNGSFSHKGTKVEIRADGNWNEGGRPNPAPFYMSNKGYGVLRHTFSQGAYDFTDTDAVALTHFENRFDAFYFIGSSFNTIIELYTRVTGRPNFLPVWGLELGDADAYMTRDSKTKDLAQEDDGSYKETTPDVIARIAEKYREHDMPGGWLLVNDGYGCGHIQLDYVVNALRDYGFYTGLWTEGALDRIKWEVGTAGSRVQKIDVAWSGRAYQHALECNKIAAKGIEDNSDGRAFVWTVQGWAGTQRYGICWTGDQYGSWDLIRYHIPTLLGSSLSGQAYATTDVDGIFGGSPETYTRDLQWKCFTPALYVMNGWSHLKKSPWAYEEPYLSLNRTALKQKLRMTPYMYTYCRKAWDDGSAIVRPMLWNYPNDRKTWGTDTAYQFMLGDDLLIAPVYNSMRINKGWRRGDGIYLPAGTWIDYTDGRRVVGPRTIAAYPITLENIPVFVKAGAIIPLYPEMLYSYQKPRDVITFDIYPHGDSEFTWYEDDGNTRAYQRGESATQRITCSAPEMSTAGDFTITVEPQVGSFKGQLAKREYAFTIHSQFKPLGLMLDGQELVEISSENPAAVYANIKQGWYYDAKDRFGVLHVKTLERCVRTPLTLFVDNDETCIVATTPDYPVPEITNELDKTAFVVTTNSGSSNVNNVIDGTPETMWHSNYNKNSKESKEYPYTIDVDIGLLSAVNGVGYMPRAGLSNGTVDTFEVYVSRIEGVFSDKPIAKASLKGKLTEGVMSRVEFPATWGRYVRFKFLSSIFGATHPYASAAELDIYQDITVAPLPDETKALSAIKPASVTGTIALNKGIKGTTIVVDDTDWTNGITAQVGSEIVYDYDGTWEKILGHAGMEKAINGKGQVTFRIFADQKKIFERLNMNGTQVKQLINVVIPAGTKKIRFVLTQEDGGSATDTGVWTDLNFFRAGSAVRD